MKAKKKRGEVVLSTYELENNALWSSIQDNFRPPQIPTWSSARTGEKSWRSSDYAMEVCCTLECNKSRAFQTAHQIFDGLAREIFDEFLTKLQAKCSFVTQYSVHTNQNLHIHTDHPNGYTVTFQGPVLGGSESAIEFYEQRGSDDPTRSIVLTEGATCCFDADVRHATAPVLRGERWVWVLFYGPILDSGLCIDIDSDGDLDPPRKKSKSKQPVW